MPSKQASPIYLSPIQQELLQRLVKRGHIILEAAQGTSNTKIAHQWQVDYETVRRWRDRWHAAESRLQVIEATGKPKLFFSPAILPHGERIGMIGTFSLAPTGRRPSSCSAAFLASVDELPKSSWPRSGPL